jgi:hypothetical protein
MMCDKAKGKAREPGVTETAEMVSVGGGIEGEMIRQESLSDSRSISSL